MVYFIDSNIFLRALTDEDKKMCQDCTSLLRAVKNNQIEAVTSSLVLAEVGWTIDSYYGFTKSEIVKALKGITRLSGLQIKDEYNVQIGIFCFQKKNVKLIDAFLASIREIQAKKWMVVSYDHDFDKLGVLREEPEVIIRKLNRTAGMN